MSAETTGHTVKLKKPDSQLAGRMFLVALGLLLAAVGMLFVWLMARSYLRAKEMRTWPEIPCVIISSELEERRHDENSPAEFRQNLAYGYEWQGKPYTGDHLTLRGNPWSSKRDEVEARAANFPAGKATVCWVNPANPDFAVLKLDSLAPGYSIWFPALFMVGGLGISGRALFAGKNTQRLPITGKNLLDDGRKVFIACHHFRGLDSPPGDVSHGNPPR